MRRAARIGQLPGQEMVGESNGLNGLVGRRPPPAVPHASRWLVFQKQAAPLAGQRVGCRLANGFAIGGHVTAVELETFFATVVGRWFRGP